LIKIVIIIEIFINYLLLDMIIFRELRVGKREYFKENLNNQTISKVFAAPKNCSSLQTYHMNERKSHEEYYWLKYVLLTG